MYVCFKEVSALRASRARCAKYPSLSIVCVIISSLLFMAMIRSRSTRFATNWAQVRAENHIDICARYFYTAL